MNIRIGGMMGNNELTMMRKVRVINHCFSVLNGKIGRITQIDKKHSLAPYGVSFLDRPIESKRLFFSEDELELV